MIISIDMEKASTKSNIFYEGEKETLSKLAIKENPY